MCGAVGSEDGKKALINYSSDFLAIVKTLALVYDV